MRIFFCFLFLIGFGFTKIHSQLFDSISQSFLYKPKIILKFDTRNSFITNQYAKFNGLKIGLSYHNTSKIGAGYHWMKQRLIKSNSVEVDSNYLHFGYGVLFYEYNFYKSKHWNAEIPVQFGIGRAAYSNSNLGGTFAKTWMVIYEPAMTIEYRFLKYFGIGGGVGFRLAIKTNNEIKEKFTAPEYILRFKIYFGDIYKEQILKE